ncbi:MAG TPA: type II secretion system F family protein [Gammaproteobacteria bacterium]|nr:type II secretion system F family protein [Gammaproteobacteria bacterium]
MDNLLVEIWQNPGWAFASALIFVAVVLLVEGAVALLLNRQSITRERLQRMLHPERAKAAAEPEREGGFLVRVTQPVSRVITPRQDWRQSRIRRKLVHAGIRAPRSLEVFMGLKGLLALGLPLLFLLGGILLFGVSFVAGQPSVGVGVLAMALLGFYLPDLVVWRRRVKRLTAFRDGFADAMDMLVVCVEAGLGLDAAVQRVGRELQYSHAEIAEEFAIVGWELRAGKSREDALRGLADRTAMEEVRSLVGILIQSEHFGTGVAKALRENAQDLRTMRIQAAQEKAAKLPVKMLVPVILFIFPALFLVILGPAFIRIFRGLTAVAGGG